MFQTNSSWADAIRFLNGVIGAHRRVSRRLGSDYPLTIDKSKCIVLVDNLGEFMGKPTDLVQGTLDLLILKTIALGPMHGWAIGQRIQQVSKDVLQVQQGSLYPALHRLEHQGWIRSEWGESENKRRAKYYSLTKAGRTALDRETANWERLSSAISLVLKTT